MKLHMLLILLLGVYAENTTDHKHFCSYPDINLINPYYVAGSWSVYIIGPISMFMSGYK